MLKITKTQLKDKKDITYPCLGIYNTTGIIVLFTNETTGTVIVDSKTSKLHNIGRYFTTWGSNWIPYTGTITLTNEL